MQLSKVKGRCSTTKLNSRLSLYVTPRVKTILSWSFCKFSANDLILKFFYFAIKCIVRATFDFFIITIWCKCIRRLRPHQCYKYGQLEQITVNITLFIRMWLGLPYLYNVRFHNSIWNSGYVILWATISWTLTIEMWVSCQDFYNVLKKIWKHQMDFSVKNTTKFVSICEVFFNRQRVPRSMHHLCEVLLLLVARCHGFNKSGSWLITLELFNVPHYDCANMRGNSWKKFLAKL